MILPRARRPRRFRRRGAADDDLGDAVLAREFDQRAHHVVGFEPHGLRAEVAREVDVVEQLDEIARVDPRDRFRRRLDVHGVPVRVELARDARGFAQERGAVARVRRQPNHQAVGDQRAPSALAAAGLKVLAPAVESARDFAQRQFAQRRQVARLEKILERLLDVIRRIDFALAQPLAKSFDA
jgi:hypothetical protein